MTEEGVKRSVSPVLYQAQGLVLRQLTFLEEFPPLWLVCEWGWFEA